MTEWDARVDAVWEQADTLGEAAVIERMDALAAERPEDDPRAIFERAGARDFAGAEADAEPLYRRALALGLTEPHRAQAVIQLASTLRNLGRADESIAMLRSELAEHPNHELADAVRAFLALALVSQGDAAAGASVALTALAPHLPLYSRAIVAYAASLTTR
ncbi:tetratricopeptide repeat protein [Diaminobutyricibacter sp. McL0608]|uniref:tetratricopeptide repeat protein n=1 Tax=Leifsonia sp. McL0608 TaxID=3143537 RepID=UPI0031F2E08C